jgi:hypothetical protein
VVSCVLGLFLDTGSSSSCSVSSHHVFSQVFYHATVDVVMSRAVGLAVGFLMKSDVGCSAVGSASYRLAN